MNDRMSPSSKQLRLALLGSSTFFAFCATSGALAAETGSSEVDEILVTARRVEERLQDVPVSITVLKQDDLTKLNITRATDLATYTPSLSVNQRYGPDKASFAIRGFNQTTNTAPTIGSYFAEVVGVRAQGGVNHGNTIAPGSFTDLASVQVLKGPQGTLFGRNTTGGAIMLTPQKPTDEFGGYIEGTYGNYDQVRVGGALNVPLADTFKVRLTVESNNRDGYMKNHAAQGPKAFNDIGYTYGRLSILADLTPDLENYIVAYYSRSRTNGYASRTDTCLSPAGLSGATLLQVLSCNEQLARQTARGDGPYDVENNLINPKTDSDQWQVINTTTWHASDTITIKNIMSYGEVSERLNVAYLSTNYTVPNYNNEGGFNLTTNISPFIVGPNNAPVIVPAGTRYVLFNTDGAGPNTYNAAQSTFTEELQIQGRSSDDRFSYVLGGYLEFSRPTGFNESITGNFLNCTSLENLACSNPLTFGAFTQSRVKMSFDNHGIFGQGTFKLTEKLSLTAGGRWTFDSITGLASNTRFSLSSAAGSYIDPRTGVRIRRLCSNSVVYGTTTVVQDISSCPVRKSNRSDKPTWALDLSYKISPDMMIYGKYARGYRQGGINFSAVGRETWGPESLDTFEGGFKASFQGAVSGYFNASVFHNSLKGMQVNAQLIPTAASTLAGIGPSSAILNAGKARSYGVEIDSSLRFFDSLQVSLGYAYLNTKVLSILSSAALTASLQGTPFGSGIVQVAPGTPFLDTPKHKLTLGATYSLPISPDLGDLSIGATWIHTSKAFTNLADPTYVNGFPVSFTPSNDLVNLNLDWKKVAGSPVSLSMFVTNLTKEVVRIPNQFPFAFSGGAVPSGYMPPRMYGLRLRYDFGQ